MPPVAQRMIGPQFQACLLTHAPSPLVATPYWGSAFPFRQSFKCIQVTYSKVRVMSMFASCVKLCWSLTSVALEELSEIVVGLNLEASIKEACPAEMQFFIAC